jgi:CubicO group peptidase (beta-lactamase class C family)
MTAAERAGFSPARLAMLDRVLREDYVERGEVPNALIQIWRRGELAHQGMWGHADRESGSPVREDSIFRIYSMTKPITGAALLMLMDEGRIDLEDEVSSFLPEFGKLQVFEAGGRGVYRTQAPKRPMRIVDLATHQSGLTYDWMNCTPVDAAYLEANFNRRDLPGGLDAMVAALGKIPLEFSPGDHWNYSMGMDVLAAIIQRVSGMRYGEFLRTRLFEPLGMVDTAHHCPPDKRDRLTSAYEWRDGRLSRDDRRTSIFDTPAVLEEGGAGLLSTVGDYARFTRMLLGGGELDGVRVLSRKAVSLFSRNMLTGGRTLGECYLPGRGSAMRLDGDGQSICCAVTLDLGQKHAVGSPGDFHWSGAMMTQFWVDPTEDMAVVFMTQVTQSPHHHRIPRVLRALVYGAMTDTQR